MWGWGPMNRCQAGQLEVMPGPDGCSAARRRHGSHDVVRVPATFHTRARVASLSSGSPSGRRAFAVPHAIQST